MSQGISDSIKGATPEEAQIDSALMVGANLDSSGRPVGINSSIMRRFIANLEVFQLPVSDALREVKGELLRKAFIKWAGTLEDTVDFNRSHVRAIDIDPDNGGADFFTYNQGRPHPDAIIFCGVPKYPVDHEDLSEHKDIGTLFSRNVEYHHDEDDWYNFKKRLDVLHPKIVFCAGGDDCLSWKEFIGPKYVAVQGEGFEQGFLISRDYLANIEAYLMSVESGLLAVACDQSGSVVFTGQKTGQNSVSLKSEPSHSAKCLWPLGLG